MFDFSEVVIMPPISWGIEGIQHDSIPFYSPLPSLLYLINKPGSETSTRFRRNPIFLDQFLNAY
jgi:hypothetical protein